MPNNEELVQSARSFAASMSSPYAPSLCHSCFNSFVQSIEPVEKSAALLQPEAHAFWDAIMAFISVDWTLERRDTATAHLKRAYLSCTKCQPLAPDAPLADVIACARPFDMLFQFGCLCIHKALINPVHPYKGFGRKRRRWPTRVDQLFPRGPEHTLSALVAMLPTHTFVQGLLINLVTFHRPMVFPVLMRADNHARVVTSIVTRLRAGKVMLDAGLRLANQPATRAAKRAAFDGHFVPEYRATVALLDVLTIGRDALYQDSMRFCAGYELELFRVLDELAPLFSEVVYQVPAGSESEEDLKERHYGVVRHLAADLWLGMPEALRAALGYLDQPAYVDDVATPEAMQNPYRALRFHLSHQPRLNACDGPVCGKTVHDPGAPHAFAKCSGCRAVRYCSRACQKADWTAAPTPHKAVCRALQELSTFAPETTPMTSAEFVEACTAHAFPIAHVNVLIAWARRPGPFWD